MGGFCKFSVGVIFIKNSRFLGPFYCILAAVIWGLAFVAQSEGADVGTFTFNGIRTIIGAIVLIPLVVVEFHNENKKFSASEKKKFPLKDVLIGGVCCGIPLFLGGNLQQHAFYLDLGPGKVGFITALYMVLVPLAGLFMRRKLKINIWLGVLLGITGLYLLSVPAGGFSIGKGEIIAIGGAVAFAAHILVIDYFCRRVNNIALSCSQFFVAGILSIICMFIFEEPKISDIMDAAVPILYAGIMSSGVAFTAQIFGQKYTDPTVASILLCLESVFAVIFGFIILDDKLNSREAIGCAVMFIAIILTQIPTEKFKLKK